MKLQTLRHIGSIIRRHKTWIKVDDTCPLVQVQVFQDGKLTHVLCRVLSLRSYRKRPGFMRSHTWHITEQDISRGVSELCQQDPSARGRVDRLQLTCRDVESIIQTASLGIIKLELNENVN